jgi:hypothetical protein
MTAKTNRRVTYRPDLTAQFSLKDLLKSSSPVSIFLLSPHISVKWNIITDSDPIEDLRGWQKSIEELKERYYYEMVLWDWNDRGFDLWQMCMPRGVGKYSLREMMQHMIFLNDRTAFAQVGPNLRQLKLKINRKALKKEKAKKLKPQRDEWRRQERRRNKRLPGR